MSAEEKVMPHFFLSIPYAEMLKLTDNINRCGPVVTRFKACYFVLVLRDTTWFDGGGGSFGQCTGSVLTEHREDFGGGNPGLESQKRLGYWAY